MRWDVKTKFNAFIMIILLLISCGVFNVWMADIYMSDTQNTYSTKIWCGNGNVYNVTFANLALALALGTDVSLPPCNITITSTLTIASHTVLHGVSPALSILFMEDSGNNDLMDISSKHNIEIRNICFDMNNDSQTSHSSYTIIDIDDSDYITIDNCILKHGTTGNMIGGDDDCSYIDVSCCVFDHREWWLGTGHYGAGVRFNGNYNSVKNCRFYDLMGAAIYEEHDTVAGQIPSAYNIITGNFMTGYGCIGVAVEGWGGSGDGPKAGMTIISNNIVYALNGLSAATAGDGGGYGLSYPRAFSVCNNCTVTGNIINGVKSGIGVVSSSGKIVFGVVITDNVIGNIGTKYGVNIEYAKQCIVSDNFIYTGDAGSSGIQIWAAFNNTITGNVITGFPTGISESTGSNYNIIVGNNVDCTTDIAHVGANTIHEHNIGTVV